MVKSRKRTSKRHGKKRQRGGFAGIIKEAIVPIAFLSGNVKLKKKFFNNKTIMIPIFKNLNDAKLNRDKKTKGKRGRRRTGRRRTVRRRTVRRRTVRRKGGRRRRRKRRR